MACFFPVYRISDSPKTLRAVAYRNLSYHDLLKFSKSVHPSLRKTRAKINCAEKKTRHYTFCADFRLRTFNGKKLEFSKRRPKIYMYKLYTPILGLGKPLYMRSKFVKILMRKIPPPPFFCT